MIVDISLDNSFETAQSSRAICPVLMPDQMADEWCQNYLVVNNSIGSRADTMFRAEVRFRAASAFPAALMFSLGLGYRERSCRRNYFLNETKKVRNIPLFLTSLIPLWALHCYSMTPKLSLANSLR